jgi:hypothetical protein
MWTLVGELYTFLKILLSFLYVLSIFMQCVPKFNLYFPYCVVNISFQILKPSQNILPAVRLVDVVLMKFQHC